MHWLKAARLTALDGQGVAMAQRVLVADELRKGRLTQPFGPVLDRKDFNYCLIYPQNRLRKPALVKFRVWLIELAHAER
jgi:LysR family glycine cleavage system transcriptional activator